MRPQVFSTLLLLLTVLPAKADEEIPVETFASLPDVSQLQLSPDGRHVASLVRLTGEDRSGTAVSIYNVAEGTETHPIFASNEKFVINWIRWANDRYLLLSARFPAVRFGTPTTETRLISLDIETGDTDSVFTSGFLSRQRWYPQFHDRIIDMLPDEENKILVSISLRSPESSSVVAVDVARSRVSRVERDRPHVTGWVTDRQHRVRIAIKREDTEYQILHRAPDGKKWGVLWEFESFAEDQVWPIGFGQDPDALYVSAYHEGRLAMLRVDLASPDLAREVVFASPNYDVAGDLIYSQVKQTVVGATISQGGGFTFWDDDYARLQQGINKALPDTDNVVYSFSADERRYVVLASSDTDPGMYLLGDRDAKSMQVMAYRYGRLTPEVLAEKKVVSYGARDGLQIEGFLTLPRNADSEPLPAIVFPHGGPISFDDGGFDYWTQYFASRGYAVLQMNFRGSAGYGYDFMQSGLQNWGLDMQNDVEDGTRWLIEQGIADPERICVVGASYGGYAALMEAARNPDLYRCAVSFAGVTDVAYLVSSQRRYTNYDVAKKQIGSDLSALRKRSPINLSQSIDVPVLLAHGTKDRSVRVRHSQRMHRALRKDDKPVTYVELEDGDHYLSNQDHRLQFFRAMDEFLRQNL